MGNEGRLQSANKKMKGEVGNNSKGVINRGVFVCLCACVQADVEGQGHCKCHQ